MLLRVDESVRPYAWLAAFAFREVRVSPRHQALDADIRNLVEDYGRRFALPPGDEALRVLKPARQMYAAVGIDPTKTRPSSEALLRRIRQGKELYHVNSVVDCFNMISLQFFAPVGLYDAANLKGDVAFRLGREGESYAGIGREEIHLQGRYCLCDDLGPFGNPSADSYRTRITSETDQVLAVFFLPYGWPETSELVSACPQIFFRYHRAKVCAAAVISDQTHIHFGDAR